MKLLKDYIKIYEKSIKIFLKNNLQHGPSGRIYTSSRKTRINNRVLKQKYTRDK